MNYVTVIATQKLDDKYKQVGIFFDRNRLSVSTLRHWERGERAPQGPALVLLNVVQKEPEAVLRALR